MSNFKQFILNKSLNFLFILLKLYKLYIVIINIKLLNIYNLIIVIKYKIIKKIFSN